MELLKLPLQLVLIKRGRIKVLAKVTIKIKISEIKFLKMGEIIVCKTFKIQILFKQKETTKSYLKIL